MVCRVHSCGCGCTLRTGSLIIGILDLLSFGTLFILAVILTSAAAAAMSEYAAWYNVYLTVAVLSGVVLITDILLLIGVVTAERYLLLPWIVLAYIILCLNSIGSIWLGVIFIGVDDFAEGYSTASSAFVTFALKLYYIIVVQSHFLALKQGTYQYFDNETHVTIYPALPQPNPNGQQQFYPSVNAQQTGYTNEQQPYPNGSQHMYPHDQQAGPSVQETSSNSQTSRGSDLQQDPREHEHRFQSEQQPLPGEQQLPRKHNQTDFEVNNNAIDIDMDLNLL